MVLRKLLLLGISIHSQLKIKLDFLYNVINRLMEPPFFPLQHHQTMHLGLWKVYGNMDLPEDFFLKGSKSSGLPELQTCFPFTVYIGALH